MGDKDSKTEKATPKKRNDERKKGNIPLSKDVVSVATLFAAVLVLRLTFGGAASSLGDYLAYCFSLIRGDFPDGISKSLFLLSTGLVARITGPLLGVTILVSVVATMSQTRMLVSFESIKPKFSKLNPLNGLKRLFSLRSVVMAGMNLVKIIILMVIIYTSLQEMIQLGERYMYADLGNACRHFLLAIFTMVLKVGAAFLVLSAVDFFYQRFEYEKNMRMSKEEIKEEYKQTEGDPKIKGKIKQLQRQMAQSRMMGQVPNADVIIRNPTHVAVALRYRAGTDAAPVVVAMGVDSLALRIVSVAEAHQIVVIENVSLARALLAEARLNMPIPQDLYEAVAEVMVYLYKLGKIEA